MENYELYHHGIKGMKWGVRRYQNKDGSLTAAGKKRRSADFANEAKSMSTDELRRSINRMNLEKRYNDLTRGQSRAVKVANSIEQVNNTASAGTKVYRSIKGDQDLYGKTANQAVNVVSKSASLVKKTDRIASNKKRIDLGSMSDRDLQEAVNRLDLERQYSSLKKESVSRGKVQASEVLSVAGDVLAVSASAVGLAVGIKKLVRR